MALTGIPRIDDLFSNPAATPIATGEADVQAVGAIQDLLIGHGAAGLPGLTGTARGTFGSRTQAAVAAFQSAHQMPSTGTIDNSTLQALATTPAISPIAAHAYVTLVLDLPWTGFIRLVALTAQYEAAGRFTARNRNTDRAGLSFGIIQWAQKPGRLSGLLRAFQAADGAKFVNVFGGGDGAVAAGLLAHTALPMGGVAANGSTTNPAFDLVDATWDRRFVTAGRDRGWQKTQLDTAVAAFQGSCTVVRSCAPAARSERGLAFLLDVANQFGNGGLKSICGQCHTSGMDEPAFLQAVEDESIRRVTKQFGAGSAEATSTANRRASFRTSPLLSEGAFVDD